MPEDYAEKRQARIDRFKERAEAARTNSDALRGQAHDMAGVIPFGQPILVGHHSEKRDRNYRERITSKFRKSFEEGQRADYWLQRAAAAEANTAISSDDPEAVEKLTEKIETAEKAQELMKAANKIIKKKGLSKDGKISQLVVKLNYSQATAEALLKADFCGREGYPPYRLQNNNANIRRMKQRLEQLRAASRATHKETAYNGFKVVENPEENRVQFFFDEKPSAEVRQILKDESFKFSKRNGNAWQRYLNPRGVYAARYAVEQILKLNQ